MCVCVCVQVKKNSEASQNLMFDSSLKKQKESEQGVRNAVPGRKCRFGTDKKDN